MYTHVLPEPLKKHNCAKNGVFFVFRKQTENGLVRRQPVYRVVLHMVLHVGATTHDVAPAHLSVFTLDKYMNTTCTSHTSQHISFLNTYVATLKRTNPPTVPHSRSDPTPVPRPRDSKIWTSAGVQNHTKS